MTRKNNSIESPISLATLSIFLVLAFVASVILVDVLVVNNSKSELSRLKHENETLKNKVELISDISKYQDNIAVTLRNLRFEVDEKTSVIHNLHHNLISSESDKLELTKNNSVSELEILRLKSELNSLFKKYEYLNRQLKNRDFSK